MKITTIMMVMNFLIITKHFSQNNNKNNKKSENKEIDESNLEENDDTFFELDKKYFEEKMLNKIIKKFLI